MQKAPNEPPPLTFRVTWAAADGIATVDAIAAPRVEEGVLIIKPTPSTVLWVPLGTILGPIKIEGI